MVIGQLPILKIYELEQSQKHSVIFEWFHRLQPSCSFIIESDHDPEPLYHQMRGHLGAVFNWDCTEQGPELWKVLVQKNETGELTVGEIAAKDIRKAEAMKKLGIDYCCGGKKSIRKAAAEAGIPTEYLEKALSEAEHSTAEINNNFNNWEADFLVDYIYNQHHKYFYDNRDTILELAARVKEVHNAAHPELVQLTDLIEKLFNELKVHFYKEEETLFPYIKELVVYKKYAIRPLNQIAIGKGPLAMMYMEHEAAGDILKVIRSIARNYLAPADGCSSFKLLYIKLEELEGNLHQHIHLENNILFPKALELEKELG